jgi:hypothetical protein
MPTTAAHDPAAVASASRASISEVDPRTATVLPRRSPPQGNRSANSARTGNTRARSAGTAPSPLSLAIAGADIRHTSPHQRAPRGDGYRTYVRL